MTDNDRLEILRKQINEVDDTLVHTLDERFAICQEIGKIKKKLGMEVYVPSRESQVIQRLSDLEIHEGMVSAIWPTIMEYSRSLQ